MAARVVFQKFSSGMSGASLLGARASASARAAAPFIPRPSGGVCNKLYGAAHPCLTFPSNRGIHGFTARNYDLFTCGRAADKTRVLTSDSIPSVTVDHMKPIFVDPIRGVKQTFSSSAFTGHKISGKAKPADWRARWAALDAELAEKSAAFNKFMRTQLWLSGFACFSCLLGAYLDQVGSTHQLLFPDACV